MSESNLDLARKIESYKSLILRDMYNSDDIRYSLVGLVHKNPIFNARVKLLEKKYSLKLLNDSDFECFLFEYGMKAGELYIAKLVAMLRSGFKIDLDKNDKIEEKGQAGIQSRVRTNP
jgi:hypothetical protein